MYYKIEIDLAGSYDISVIGEYWVLDPVGHFRFDAIVFATE